MAELLDKAGFSYSGISDIIHNMPEQSKALLQEIDWEYNDVKKQIETTEKELELLRAKRKLLVSSFIHAHKALNLGEKPLCFIDYDKTIVVEIKGENTIDYSTYELTPL